MPLKYDLELREMDKFYVTTPIYYVNDKPHIGHAYTSVAADVIARFKALDGYAVHYLTGTDEHGQKVEKSAQKFGKDTQDFVDEVSVNFRKMHEDLHCSNNDFIRTTESRHKSFVQDIWRKLEQKGYIYLDEYAGWYSVRDEAFYQESELIDGKAPTGAEVEWVKEESYFLKLSAFQDKLLEYYQNNPGFIMPESRLNEVVSFVSSGLQDLSVSRTSFKWGVPVPGNDKHIMYVWIDALFNYISACPDKWPCDLHIVGKDILRFHAVYWPALLMALDMELPKRLFAHGWWTNEGQKISKSLGNVLDPYDLIDKFSVDYLRFYLMREFPFGNDGNYSEASFINRINAELANNIGNLTQRTVTLYIKKVGENFAPLQPDQLQSKDKEILAAITHAASNMRAHMDSQKLQQAIGEAISLGNAANEYIDECAPWAEKDEARRQVVLQVLLNVIYGIGVLLQPFVPESAAKILAIFGADGAVQFEVLSGDMPLNNNSFNLQKPQIVFSRLER